jgi:hydroxyethylthiazole kinase-like uncharacterized protein yjeF
MDWPLLRTDALRDLERRAAQGLPAGALMQRAGDAAARWILRRHPQASRIAVVCGPGNNGGDGYVCAHALQAAGRTVACVALAQPATDDARAAAARWQAVGGRTLGVLPAPEDWDLAVDALFGIGLARPLAGPWLAAAHWLNALAGGCVALDVPSGLDADTGAWVGGVPGVLAGATVTFLAAKPGLFTASGIDACGTVVLDPLGIAAPASHGAINGPGAFASVLKPRLHDTHKGKYGNVLVIGGASGMVGAPVLAARAALRLGAGRVYIDAIGSAIDLDPQMPELMFRRADTLGEPRVTVIGCGLGTGSDAHRHLQAALGRDEPCVIDADALNLLATDAALREQLAAARAPRVLTPHPLEAARLLGLDAIAVQADRVGAALQLAAQAKAAVVLKGAGTVIADGPRYWINPTGGPALASAGTGDVLAGMIGALLAQGFPNAEAVLAAVWLHGQAAYAFGADVGLTASDVAPRAASVLGHLRRR